MIYVALDLETTGLDASRDEIIEVGAVKFDDRRELGAFSSLVNPKRPIPLQVSQLTGITDRDVSDAPVFSAVRARLERFVGHGVIVGHYVSFDLAFLRQQNCFRDNAYIDTFALATILMPHESRYSLGKLMDSLGIAFTGRHRALDDARASMHLFRELQERAIALPPEALQTINSAARGKSWALGSVFRDAERAQSIQGEGNSIAAQLRAKGQIARDGSSFLKDQVGEPLVPVDRRVALDIDALAAMLEESGTFSAAFPGFEYRPQQVDMLREVARAFNQCRHVLVEAGTGTGKSIAYLLPAIYWAVQNGERVVISTNTINLQDQLYGKDIPDLQKLLPFQVRATVLKGRNNYLCMRRLEALRSKPDLQDNELAVLSKILVWLPGTVTGDRTELFLPSADDWMIWSQLSADTPLCTGERCVYNRQGRCFFYQARRLAENAHLIIVNHALLLSDVATGSRVLPSYNFLIVDEAHHLENATTSQLGYEVTHREVAFLLSQIGRSEGTSEGFLHRARAQCDGRIADAVYHDLVATIHTAGDSNESAMRCLDSLFQDLAAFVAEQGGRKGSYDYRLRLTDALRIQPDWAQIEMAWDVLSGEMGGAGEALAQIIEILQDSAHAQIPGYDDLVQEGIGLAKQLDSIRTQMEAVLLQPQPDQITWLSTRANSEDVPLCVAPLYVGHLVEQHLLWPKEAVIFTSATLRTDGDFGFIKDRLGARDAEELCVGSPFDYESQVLLCLPTDIPEPDQPYYQKSVNESLVALAKATRGRMLALFTSYSQLRAVQSAISHPLAAEGLTVFAQGGGASRRQLLENLRTVPGAVLLGTRSFWEGVDVPGEALSCLAMVKLPFAVPSDPVFAARSESMDDPFYQYAVPDAVLRFRQGFGRLIRSRSDRGVVVVLDKRVQTKRYGELFLRSLPACTIARGSIIELSRLATRWIDEGPEGFENEGYVQNAAVVQNRLIRENGDELEYAPLEDY